MSILSEVKKRRMAAMKEKKNDPNNELGTKEKMATYTTLLGEFERIDKGIKDQRAAGVINSMIENAKATISDIRERNLDQTKIDSIQIEIDTLQDLLPKALAEDDLVRIKGASSHIGEYMKAVREEALNQGKIADNVLAKKIWEGS